MLAALIEACERGHDHDHDPVKVKGRYSGLELDLGFFSCLRAVNRESSFSVLG
jgi:sarcosine oxidase subunit beta